MRYIKVLLLVLIFFFFAVFVVQNNAVLGQKVSFCLDLFMMPPLESIPLPLYFVLLTALLLGALVCLLFLAGDRIRMSMALRRAKKKIGVLEREVAQLRAIPLSGKESCKALEELKPESETTDKTKTASDIIAAGPGDSDPSSQTVPSNTPSDKDNNQAGDKESGSVEKL